MGQVKNFRALFTACGFTVLTDLHCAYVGITIEFFWMHSTKAIGGSGRPCNRELFCRDDGMVWVKARAGTGYVSATWCEAGRWEIRG